MTICLNMIVKNEAAVIRRCLDSVRPFIDHWVIVDTGSTDGTQDIIRNYFADVPGELHERPWKNFGHNRSEALQFAQGKADYLLVIDADEELIVEKDFSMPKLTADSYMLFSHRSDSPGVNWQRETIIHAALPWRYEGVLHEYLECGGRHREVLRGIEVRGYFDGARNVDPIKKYAADAMVLENALRDDPGNPRYTFYLAQSYRDSHQFKLAIRTYEKCVALGGWDEEVFESLLQIGALKVHCDPANCVEALLRAYSYRPTRAEPLCALASYYRGTRNWALTELFARAAVAIPRPSDILFVDDSVYAWRAIDELAIATYWLGKFKESEMLNYRLLGEGKLPESQRARIEENVGFCKAKL